MKVIPIALAVKRATGYMTEAVGLFIVRRDGQAFGFTSTDVDSVLDLSDWWDDPSATAVTLNSRQGLDASNWTTTSGLEVSNGTLRTLNDGSLFDEDELYQGKWREARFWVFQYDYEVATSASDLDVIGGGEVGEAEISMNEIVIELRDITQKLQQPMGIPLSKTCRDRLGGPFCRIDLAEFTVSLTVTSVSVTDGKRVFTCSGATQDDDWFGNGKVLWTDGDNEGVWAKVSAFADGQFELILSMWKPIQAGDTLEAVAGCRGRHERSLANPSGVSDCIDKFDNILNFDGEPFAPLTDELTKPVNADA